MSTHLDRARWLFRQVRYDLAERELLHALAAEPASACRSSVSANSWRDWPYSTSAR